MAHCEVLVVDVGAEPSRRDGGHGTGCLQRAGGCSPSPAHREALSGAGVTLKGHRDGDTGDL